MRPMNPRSFEKGGYESGRQLHTWIPERQLEREGDAERRAIKD